MNPKEEALALLDRSLDRLQRNIERMKQDQLLLLDKSENNQKRISLLEEKRAHALKELYTMRDMIAKELHWNVDKKIKFPPSPPTPVIWMTDNDSEESHSHE